MSRTPAQIYTTVHVDGTLPMPQGQGVSFFRKVRDMRREPTVRLARCLALAPILASEWSIEKETHAPEGADEFISKQLLPMRMHIIRTGITGCMDYGWQPYEKVFELREDMRIYLKYLKPLLHDITEVLVDVNDGSYAGLRQTPQHRMQFDLTVEETLLLNQEVEGTNWYGEATMRAVEGPYDRAIEVEDSASRYDRKVAGSHWIITYPYGTSNLNGVETDNYTVAQQLLNSLESSGGIAIPRTIQEALDALNAQVAEMMQWKVELLSDSGIGAGSFIDRFNYLDKQKVRAFGLPERAVLEGQFGTKAEAEAHADFAITNMDLRHKEICQALNKHVVNHLLRLNYGEEYEDTVYIQPAPITDTALTYLRTLYDKLLSSTEGLMMELSLIDLEQIRDRLNIPTLPTPDMDYYTSGVQNEGYVEETVEEEEDEFESSTATLPMYDEV